MAQAQISRRWQSASASGYRELVPEGDTIHHAANRIRDVLLDGVPERIASPQPRHAPHRWPQRLSGRAVRSVDAHGKHLFLRFEGGLTLHSHLRMSGAWGIYAAGRRWPRPRARAWLLIAVNGVEVVQFDGPVLELCEDRRLRLDPRLARLGPDVLAPELDEQEVLARLGGGDHGRSIGEALLDQRVIAGIGNVWKSEACFAARVNPWNAVDQVPQEQIVEILRFARAGMARCAIEGHRARPKAVYGRRGLPCSRCGTPIGARGQGEQNRVTYWCAACQR